MVRGMERDLKGEIARAGRRHDWVAREMGMTAVRLSQILGGHSREPEGFEARVMGVLWGEGEGRRREAGAD